MPDDMLIELVMLYLDIDEINMLFSIFSYKKMKRTWIENVVAQGERYYSLNKPFVLKSYKRHSVCLKPYDAQRFVIA